MKAYTILCAVMSMFGWSVSVAQPRMLTVEESVNIGLENSRILHASKMKSEYAGSKASEMSAMLYPSLKLQASYQRLSEVPEFKIPFPGVPTIFPYIPNTYTARASLQQPLFTGWKLQGAVDNAWYQAEASRNDVERDKAELVFTIRLTYWSLFRAKEIRRLADENVTQVTAHLQDIENLLNQGLATANDVMKVKVQLANSRILQSDAVNNVRVAGIVLNSTIGIALDTEIEIASPLTSSPKDFPELEPILKSAFQRRPDVLALESRVKAADAGIVAAAGGWFPQIVLTGNYYYSRPNQRILPSKDEFTDTWDFGISLQFDLWNNLTTMHQTNQAKAQYEQTKDVLATLRDGITLEVMQSYLGYQQAKERIHLAELSVEQANESYRITAEKFKTGLTTSSELLDAEVALLQSKLQFTQSLVDHELAQARLDKAIGELH
jgi:outer membrane protein